MYFTITLRAVDMFYNSNNFRRRVTTLKHCDWLNYTTYDAWALINTMRLTFRIKHKSRFLVIRRVRKLPRWIKFKKIPTETIKQYSRSQLKHTIVALLHYFNKQINTFNNNDQKKREINRITNSYIWKNNYQLTIEKIK